MKQLLAGCFSTADEERVVYEKSTKVDPKTREPTDVVDPRGVPKDIEGLIRKLNRVDQETQNRAKVRSRELSFYHILNISTLAYLIALLCCIRC